MFSAPKPAESSHHDSAQEPDSSGSREEFKRLEPQVERPPNQESTQGNSHNPENNEASEHPSEQPNPNEIQDMESSQEVPKDVETCESNSSPQMKPNGREIPSSSEHGVRFMALPKKE